MTTDPTNQQTDQPPSAFGETPPSYSGNSSDSMTIESPSRISAWPNRPSGIINLKVSTAPNAFL